MDAMEEKNERHMQQKHQQMQFQMVEYKGAHARIDLRKHSRQHRRHLHHRESRTEDDSEHRRHSHHKRNSRDHRISTAINEGILFVHTTKFWVVRSLEKVNQLHSVRTKPKFSSNLDVIYFNFLLF